MPRKRKFPVRQEYCANAKAVLKLSLIDQIEDLDDPEWFSPVYTHQLFSQEFITGYTNLSIKMYFAQPTLKCLVEIEYDKIWPEEKHVTDIEGVLEKWLRGGFTKSREEFKKYLVETFTLPGNIIHEYSKPSRKINNKLDPEIKTNQQKETKMDHYTILCGELCSFPGMRQWHERLQFFLLLFIEACSYIDADDPIWEICVLVRRTYKRNAFITQTCGYLTLYKFFAWPCGRRLRLSQILIFSPFQRLGHGSQMLRKIYEYASEKDYVEVNIEDPSEGFQFLRDLTDMECCLREGFFQRSEEQPQIVGKKRKRPDCLEKLSPDYVQSIQRKVRITQEQIIRVYECLKFDTVNISDEAEYRKYRLNVKRRLYEILQEELAILGISDPSLVKDSLHKLYMSTEKRYSALLSKIKNKIRGGNLFQQNTFI